MEKQHFHTLRPWLIGAAALALSLMPHVASAATIRTVLDGHDLSFPIPPVIEQDRTLVAARTLIESLGGTIGWEQSTHTVSATLGTKQIKAVMGQNVATVNGASIKLDLPVRVTDGHTMIPLRFFSENLGLAVSWDAPTSTIFIDSRRSDTGGTVSRDGSTVSREATAMVAEAKKLVGAPYAWGGTNPVTGFDCSGFIYYLGKKFGITLPRTSEEMFTFGVPVTKANLQAGDLVFFATYTSGASHVGVYDGQGNFIQAENSTTGVVSTPLSKAWWAARYLGARRIFR